MAGGLTNGKSHAKGGIKMKVKSTGQNIEVEGGEGIINKHTMSSTDKHTFEGKEMTACEISSELNQKTGNGVSFDCDETKNTDMTPTDPSTGFAKGGKPKRKYKKKKMAKSKKKTGAFGKLVSKIMKRDDIPYKQALAKAKDEYVSGATSQKKQPKKSYKGRLDKLKSKSAPKKSYSGRPKKAKGGELMDADTQVDYAKGGNIPKDFDLENAEEIRGNDKLDSYVKEYYGEDADWTLYESEGYELEQDALAVDDFGNKSVFYIKYAKGGKVEIEKAKRKLNEAKKTKISSAIDDATRELDRVSEKYGYYAKGGKFDYFDDYSASELAYYLGLEENEVADNMAESIEMAKEMAMNDPFAKGGMTDEKVFAVNTSPIGKAKYSINLYEGDSHKDGSPFIGIRIFSNKKDLATASRKFRADGYKEVKDISQYLKIKYYGKQSSYHAEGGELMDADTQVDYAKGGDVKTFEVGGIVRISEDNDNENYDDFRGKDLRIVSVAYDTSDHFGYDESMDGMALYDLEVADTGEDVPFSLYEYEVETYAKGGKVSADDFTPYARVCDVTGEGMNEGYIMGDSYYVKYEKDLIKELRKDFPDQENLSDEELTEQAYDDEYYYYTEWEDPSDVDYVEYKGKLYDKDELEDKIPAKDFEVFMDAYGIIFEEYDYAKGGEVGQGYKRQFYIRPHLNSKNPKEILYHIYDWRNDKVYGLGAMGFESEAKAKKYINQELQDQTYFAKGGQTKKFNNGGNIMEKKLELAKSLSSQVDIDFQYLDWDEINSFDELEEAVDNNGFFQQEVIYYATAMDYLREEDPSLREALELAGDMGYDAGSLNSEILASILKSERVRESFYELRTEVDDFFDELED